MRLNKQGFACKARGSTVFSPPVLKPSMFRAALRHLPSAPRSGLLPRSPPGSRGSTCA